MLSLIKYLRILVGLFPFAVLCSCDDHGDFVNASFPGRQAFDDGRELFFLKHGREVTFISWAPDGRRFAFSDQIPGGDDPRVWAHDIASNRDVLLAFNAHWPRWSPRGDLILYQDINGPIYTVRPDGTGRTKILNSSYPDVKCEPCWSPDGNKVAVSAIMGPGYASSDIYTFDLSSQYFTRISYDDLGTEYGPLWGPDGEWIAFWKRDRLFEIKPGHRTPLSLADAAGKGIEVIWKDDDVQGALCQWICDWSPDGRYVLMAVVDNTASFWDLWALDVRNKAFTQVTSSPDPFFFDWDGTWGPDGKVYFVVKDTRNNSYSGIWRVDPNL
jgi:Tol biopolymer transport system component